MDFRITEEQELMVQAIDGAEAGWFSGGWY